MSVLTNKLDFLSDVLQDFCDTHGIELMSADDILYADDNLTEYHKDWLLNYIEVWDLAAANE